MAAQGDLDVLDHRAWRQHEDIGEVGARLEVDVVDDPGAGIMEMAVLALVRAVARRLALEVDLTGQVNAEQSGSAYMGGTGGQVDFARAMPL